MAHLVQRSGSLLLQPRPERPAKGCPTYSFSHVSRLEPGQYTPGNHYANQVNIWGGLGQLSLDMLDDRPVVASLEDDPEGCEEQPDILGSLYDETQQ